VGVEGFLLPPGATGPTLNPSGRIRACIGWVGLPCSFSPRCGDTVEADTDQPVLQSRCDGHSTWLGGAVDVNRWVKPPKFPTSARHMIYVGGLWLATTEDAEKEMGCD